MGGFAIVDVKQLFLFSSMSHVFTGDRYMHLSPSRRRELGSVAAKITEANGEVNPTPNCVKSRHCWWSTIHRKNYTHPRKLESQLRKTSIHVSVLHSFIHALNRDISIRFFRRSDLPHSWGFSI